MKEAKQQLKACIACYLQYQQTELADTWQTLL